jgi:hypothetical protein
MAHLDARLEQNNLPVPSIITGPVKAADMISLSGTDIRGDEDFRCR